MSDDALAVANLLERIGQLVRSDEQVGDLYPAQWAALRYLSRANRFSRNPMALTRYLGTTRGTTSQTLIALERKGYVSRTANPRDKRSVDLDLTKQGHAKLRGDPVARVAGVIEDALGRETPVARDHLSRILHHLIDLNNARMFGLCHTCRHFRRDATGSKASPHRCSLLEADLSDEDSEKICVEHESAT